MFKRGPVWWISFVHNGKRYRRSTETADKKLAQRIQDKVKGEVAEEKWFETLPGEEKTFRELMGKYLKEHASKKASAKNFFGYSKNLISFFGDSLLTEITPRVISQYKIKRWGDGVKPASINRELATMKKAFNLAMKEWEWVRENPVMKVSMEVENNKRDRWLTEDEEERLLGVCPDWLQELVVFALNTGMRLSEILGLNWKEVDLFRRTVTVIKSKNGEKRTIPINETVFGMLREKIRIRSIKTSLVFPSRVQTIISKCNVARAFRNAVKKAQIKDFRFHDLRHCFGTKLVQSGVDLYKVQNLLDHKTPAMTQRYAHHYPESLRDAVSVLDNRHSFSHNLVTVN